MLHVPQKTILTPSVSVIFWVHWESISELNLFIKEGTMVHRRENFLPKIAKQINAGIRTRPWASVLNTHVWAPLPSSGPGCHLLPGTGSAMGMLGLILAFIA